MVKSEAGGRFTRHTSPGVPVRRAATSEDRGTLGGDVSRLGCSGCKHVTCAFVSLRRRAGKSTSTVGPHDLPLFVRYQVESGAPFNAERDIRTDIFIERGGL